MVVVDGEGIPLGDIVTSVSPAEVNLLNPLLDVTYENTKIRCLAYDRAVDSVPLHYSSAHRKIGLTCPHRKNRRKLPNKKFEILAAKVDLEQVKKNTTADTSLQRQDTS
ncbi:hypothetical protein ACJJH9_11145 [Microbulbifer sp. DLAB2-AF]|uniref:hypothetical protein n=1 Tax=Microbulbifer sp. DLAB2-AF TaxID=3243395 RepID=UPI00403919C8